MKYSADQSCRSRLLPQCCVDNIAELLRLIVFDLGINVHRDLAVFVPSQVLHCFRIYRCGDQVGDIGVAQLMRVNIKVQTVDHLVVVRRSFAENRMKHMFDFLAVHISVVSAILCRPCLNVGPYALELRVGQRAAFFEGGILMTQLSHKLLLSELRMVVYEPGDPAALTDKLLCCSLG